jgi:hypothetical protein
MIQTDKYKKGVIALSRKATEINPRLGHYVAHYINKEARFIVQLSNGKLEIDIELARQYENLPDRVIKRQAKKIAVSYKTESMNHTVRLSVDTAWRRLFATEKRI